MTTPYVHQEYPKFLFNAEGASVRVADIAAHSALGPGWFESPGEAKAAVDPAAAPAPVVPVRPPLAFFPPVVPIAGEPVTPPAAPAQASTETDADKSEAEGLHGASIAVVIDRIAGAPREVLERVKTLEATNPNFPGGRKGVIEAVDKLLKDAPAAPVAP